MTTETSTSEPLAAQHSSDPSDSSSQREDLKDQAHQIGDGAKSAAKNAVDDAKQALHSQAEKARSGAANEVSNIAGALRGASDELRSGSAAERSFAQLADGLAGASEAVRDKDLGELIDEMNRFARNNPATFLGGAAIIGFAASRFARSSDAGSPLGKANSPGEFYSEGSVSKRESPGGDNSEFATSNSSLAARGSGSHPKATVSGGHTQ